MKYRPWGRGPDFLKIEMICAKGQKQSTANTFEVVYQNVHNVFICMHKPGGFSVRLCPLASVDVCVRENVWYDK